MRRMFVRAMTAFLLAVFATQGSSSVTKLNPQDWTNWGNGSGVASYSPADQINVSNVKDLQPVWSYRLAQRGGWELTPIVVGGMLYGVDLQGTVFALDPETGKEIWKHATGIKGSNRSVAYWPGDGQHGPRVIVGLIDRIYALDAATGAPAAGFGGDLGYIDIREGFAPRNASYRITSPPTIYKNLIIHGVSTQEFGSKGPPGDPRAYDAITGKLVWRFHIVPQPGEANFGTWGGDSWKGRSGPSTWGLFSIDTERGLVFIPVGQPADNFVGVDRPGDDLYADSILALDANTGKYKWHFQTVHHDLWDFDLSAPPVLIDLTVDGKKVPALVEATKTGMLFILDRRTGKPVFGVEERPVPQSMIPNEQTSRTQPFPVKPVPLVKQGVSRQDITTITPEANRFCTDTWNRMGFRDASIFTPPSLAGPLVYSPANAGGAGGVWGGVSVNPKTGYIFVNVAHLVSYVSVVREDDVKGSARGPATGGYATKEAFTKYMDPNGMPCIQPPWGEMVAINGNTGEVAWRVPLGKAEVYGDLGEHTGMLNYGGSLATGGGLVFIGGTTMSCSQCKYDDPVVRAFDMHDGNEVWSARLPAGTKSNVMTFVGKSGRQYIVVTTSGRPDTDIEMVAFALPRPGEEPAKIKVAPKWPVVIGTSSKLPVAITKVEDLPDGLGKSDFAQNCSVCHGINLATSRRETLEGWNTLIFDMKARGAQVDDATQQRIAAYLAKNFGP